VLEKAIHFQTPDITKVFMYSVDLYMGTISDTTYIKMELSFLPGVGKHVIDNTHYNSLQFCHTTFSYFTLFHS